MTWRHKRTGGWSSVTPKVRKNGEWITVGASTGPGPNDFGWIDPPTRSTTEYHSDIGGSIQNAFDSISSDTELVLDNGPYEETATLPTTNAITISGEPSGTEWNNPGGIHHLIDAPDWSLDTTSCASIDEGNRTLSVGDASLFSADDDVQILDSSDLYYEMDSDDLYSTHTQYKGEFAVVESVDTGSDTITLESGTHQHYDDPRGTLEVSAIDWGVSDVHITGLEFNGGIHGGFDPYGNSDAKPLHLFQVKDLWLTNLRANGWNQDLVTVGQGINSYIEDCHVDNIGRYGISHADGQTHSRVQNCTGDYIDPEQSGYLVQCGGGSTDNSSSPAPTYDIQARDCTCETADFLYDGHFAAENVRYYDGHIDSGDSRVCRMRGIDMHLIGGIYSPTRGWAFQSTQVARECSIEDAYVSDSNHGWVLWPKEDQWFGNLLMRDMQFENMTGDPIYFRATDDGQAPDIRGITIINSSWNGEWIDDARIESSSGYDSDRIDYTTVYPNDQTPAEYFS